MLSSWKINLIGKFLVTGSVCVQQDVQHPILQSQAPVLAPITSVPAQPPISQARAVNAPVFAPAISAPPISVQAQPPIAQARAVNAPVFAPAISAPPISVQAQQLMPNAAMPQQFPAARPAVFQPTAYPAMPRQHLKPLQLPKFVVMELSMFDGGNIFKCW